MFSVDLNLLYALLFVLALIVVDVILGISLSLKDSSFDMSKLPHFLESTILPYYISLVSLVFLAQIKDIQNVGTSAVAWAAIVMYISKFIWVDITGKIKNLFGIEVST